MAKVSIIVPMYNVEKYVDKCLTSLVKQTFNDIKIYAISDGSLDNSLKIAKKHALLDKRIVCLEKENGGYGSVLEYAIQNIDTEYFIICDPDDWLEENAVEVLYNKAIENNLDLVVADKYYVCNGSEPKYYDSNEAKMIIPNIVYDKEVDKFSFLCAAPHAKLYKTSIAKNIKFPRKVSYTDFVLYIISLQNAKRVMYIDVPLAYYLIDRPGNTATDISLKAVKNHITVWHSTYNQLKTKNYLLYRLYYKYKMFLKLYCNLNIDDKDTLIELEKIKKIIKKNKKYIFKYLSIKKKIDILLLSNINFNLYLKLNKLLRKSYR